MLEYQIVKNKYGYYEVVNKPSEKELADYYSRKYFQGGKGCYESGGGYKKQEIEYFLNKVEQKYLAAQNISEVIKQANGNFLDVGAGEGWALKFFDSHGWKCTGLDFSDFGMLSCNPEFEDNLITGDIYYNLNKLCESGQKYEIILLDNVLEHVRDPYDLLKRLKGILAEGGVLIVEVPNDYSLLQEKVYSEKLVSRKFWEALPDHLSYFNKEGLTSLALAARWEVRQVFTGFPIDLNLFNANTNYIENSSVGKSCHFARVEIENMLHKVSPSKVIHMYEAMADLGLGREIIALLKSNDDK